MVGLLIFNVILWMNSILIVALEKALRLLVFQFFLTENSVHTQYNKKKIHQEIHTELLNVFEIFIPPMFNITHTEFTKIYD